MQPGATSGADNIVSAWRERAYARPIALLNDLERIGVKSNSTYIGRGVSWLGELKHIGVISTFNLQL